MVTIVRFTRIFVASAAVAVTIAAAPSVGAAPVTDGPCARTPTRKVSVSTTLGLKAALATALPGDRIELADGVYAGRFSMLTSGAGANRISLCGSPAAILDGGSTDTGYVVSLKASAWDLVGFTVRNGQKGIMLDGASNDVLDRLTVNEIGDEAIHFRTFSTGNRLVGSTISGTGRRDPRFGEGVYIGSATNNWCTYTLCQPDASDGNVIEGNRISDTAAEAIDVKEGTTGGSIVGNVIDGTGAASLSFVDVKGNGWSITGNNGRGANRDGFLTELAAPGWGTGNVFSANRADLPGATGYGFNVRPGNTVRCNNTAVAAPKGLSNVACTQAP